MKYILTNCISRTFSFLKTRLPCTSQTLTLTYLRFYFLICKNFFFSFRIIGTINVIFYLAFKLAGLFQIYSFYFHTFLSYICIFFSNFRTIIIIRTICNRTITLLSYSTLYLLRFTWQSYI